MTDVGPGLGHQLNILLRRPDAVPASDLRSQESQVMEVLQRRPVPGAQSVELLIHGFLKVYVNAGLVLGRHFL